MSLTNPLLNDIIIKELGEIKIRIHSLENEISKNMNSASGDISNINARLLKQDCKIDLIHRLFNSVKNNKDSLDTPKEVFDTKKLYSEIEHSINDKYSTFVERVMNIITQYNTQQEHNMSILNQNYNNVNVTLNNYKESITNITKHISDIESRLNNIEKKSKLLENQNNTTKIRDDNTISKNYDMYDNRDDSSWTKVVKNRKNNNLKTYYNNRY